MKKIIAVFFVFTVLSLEAFGAEVLRQRLVGIEGYRVHFTDNLPLRDANNVRISNDYYKYIVGEYRNAIANFIDLGGNPGIIDTELEWALASYYSPNVIDIRPAQADAILPKNNP
ncbi:MAG: hypothetical protein LBH07_03440, partial [Treponema sp.]|nr:hypothetical protein [Treponema sp.]